MRDHLATLVGAHFIIATQDVAGMRTVDDGGMLGGELFGGVHDHTICDRGQVSIRNLGQHGLNPQAILVGSIFPNAGA